MNVGASFPRIQLQNFPYYFIILNITAVGIPLPANFSKQNGTQTDDSAPLSIADSEIHPVEASNPLASEGGAGTPFLLCIIWYKI
jgi:hypothetical protein